jgi:hypothetical protein
VCHNNEVVCTKFQFQIKGYVKFHIKNMGYIKKTKFLKNVGEPIKLILLGYSCMVPRLQMLGVHLSLQRHRFDFRPVHAGFVMESVQMGQAFIQVLWFSPVSINLPMPHIHIGLSPHLRLTLSNHSNWQCH